MKLPTFREYRDQLEALGHTFFSGPWNPNIGGIRCRERVAGRWDDMMLLAYEDDRGHGQLFAFQGTTDPSAHWLTSTKAHKDGTAIVLADQHRGCWQFGPRQLHNGRYPAFKQRAPMSFVRDANRDSILDIEALIVEGKVLSGIRGFNGHRASASMAVPLVGLYSAGCQVWRIKPHFDHVLDFANWTAPLYGNVVSYTLMDEWL